MSVTNAIMPENAEATIGAGSLGQIVDHAPCLLAYLDSDGRCEFANGYFAQWLGIEPAEIVGRHWRDLLAPESQTLLKQPLASVFTRGKEASYKGRLTFFDGKERHLTMRLAPDLGDDGDIRGAYVVAVETSRKAESDVELERSEQRFRDFAETAADWFWETDEHLRFTTIDPRYQTVLNITPQELVGHTRREIYAEEIARNPSFWEPHLRDLDQHRPIREFEFSCAGRDGKTAWISVSATPVFADDDSFIGYRGVSRNVTERKRTEEALRQSEERFKDLVEGSIQGIYVHDRWELLFVNQAVADMYGYASPDEVLALGSVEKLLSERERVRLRAIMEERHQGEEVPSQYEYEGLCKDGSVIDLWNIVRRVRWHGRDAIQTTAIDITEQKRAQGALKESEAKFRDLVEGSIQGIYVHRDYKPFFANRAFAEMLGYDSVNELVELDSMDEVFAPHERERLRGYRKARLTDKRAPVQYEADAVRKEGTPIRLELVARVVIWEGEVAIQTTAVDITARSRAQQKLKASEATARQLSRQVLEAQEVERKRLAAELHDSLSQSMFAVQLGLERCLAKCPVETRKVRRLLGDSVSKLKSNIDELHRIHMNLRPAMLDDFGLIEALRWLCDDVSERDDGPRAEAKLSLGNDAIPRKLTLPMFRIAQEALNNAAKHGNASLITLALKMTAEGIELTVRDDGVGFVGHEDGDVKPGGGRAGFGLIGMRERAAFSGGRFEVESCLGSGTKIHVVWQV